jgi:hypothetical protein
MITMTTMMMIILKKIIIIIITLLVVVPRIKLDIEDLITAQFKCNRASLFMKAKTIPR